MILFIELPLLARDPASAPYVGMHLKGKAERALLPGFARTPPDGRMIPYCAAASIGECRKSAA